MWWRNTHTTRAKVTDPPTLIKSPAGTIGTSCERSWNAQLLVVPSRYATNHAGAHFVREASNSTGNGASHVNAGNADIPSRSRTRPPKPPSR